MFTVEDLKATLSEVLHAQDADGQPLNYRLMVERLMKESISGTNSTQAAALIVQILALPLAK